MEIQSNPDLLSHWGIVVGFFLPLLLSLILQRHWSTPTKAYVSFGVILVVSAITAYFEGKFASGNLLGVFFSVLAATTVSFQGLWRPTNIAQNLEAATTITPTDEPSPYSTNGDDD